MQSSTLNSVLSSAAELQEPIRVSGVTPSARALITARYLHRSGQKNLIVLCPDLETASRFHSDLLCFLSLLGLSNIESQLFSTWEQSPYTTVTPSLRTRFDRLSVLSGLLTQESPRIIVTTLEAACQLTLPPALFQKFSLKIRVDQAVESREALLSRLQEGGYLRVDPVEDPGTFAVRGEIIDVFPPDRTHPVRIELFGDLVERIREFNPSTQRALPQTQGTAPISEISVCPARETLINSETSSLLRGNLKSHSDDLDIPRTVRDPLLSSLRDGIYPEHADTWAPFAYSEEATLWSYLNRNEGVLGTVIWPVIWNDELTCLQAHDEFLTKQKRLCDQAVEAHRVVPSVEALYPWNREIETAIRSHSRLYLDRLEMADLSSVPGPQEADPDLTTDRIGEPEVPSDSVKISAKHRCVIRDNRDLTQGTRHSLGELEPKFKLWMSRQFKTFILASTQSQLERIRFLLTEHGFTCDTQLHPPTSSSSMTLAIGQLSEGFRWPAEKRVFLTESEILGTTHTRKLQRKPKQESGSAAKDWSGLQALSDLAIGDGVVHVEHGIGRYQGLARLSLSGAPSDFLLLEYANKDRLYLPVYRLNTIQKYVGSGESMSLDRLGSQHFNRTKEKVKEAVRKLAIDLVQLYAERKIRPGIRFAPPDFTYQEFEAGFPFDETPDQLKAIGDILSDLESGRSMDRLVCGDVGYGKTEVAIRAAFRAISEGKQVAVMVPTTVLAHQHEQSFKARFKDYPFVIESASRFKNTKELKEIMTRVSEGKVDLLIGTHRVLSKDVHFRDLALIIIDEEHRFGVEHKEKLKALRTSVHVLTLSATPIPRTLHMSLSGLRDISLINMPPADRLPIRTYVSTFDEALVQRAIEFELSRGGQVFFLHNRVQTIQKTASRVQQLVPSAKIQIAHGQMNEKELEKAMFQFYEHKANVLVCTTLIESGLDLPSANTLIVERADAMGLSQLYQIRGRVGRGQQRAYAYLMIPEHGAISEDAKRRLEVMQRFVELGSGFSIASHDLEIRGGGDLLGPQQSGHIAAVGFDLYTELLEEAIQELQGKPIEPEDSRHEPEIKVPFPAFFGEDYVQDIHQRLSLYRRFSAVNQESEIDRLEEELRDRFGSPPVEAQNLLWLIRIKLLLKKMGIDALTVGPEKVSLVPGKNSRLDPAKAIALVSAHPHQYQLVPNSKLVAKVPTGNFRDLYFGLESLLSLFANSAAH